MDIIIHILIQGTWAFVMFVVPFVYVLRTGKLLRGILLAWGLMVLSTFILSVVIFYLVYKIIGSEFAVKFFPDQICIFPVILFGWIGGLIISFTANFVRGLIQDRETKNQELQSEEDTNKEK